MPKGGIGKGFCGQKLVNVVLVSFDRILYGNTSLIPQDVIEGHGELPQKYVANLLASRTSFLLHTC